MGSTYLVGAAAALAVIVLVAFSDVAPAQTESAPLSRAEVRAQARAAAAAGQLMPPGARLEFPVATASTKTRWQRQAETLADREAQAFEPAGDADILKVDRTTRAMPTTVDRATRQAETRALGRMGLLIPAGEGPGSPPK